MKHRIRAAAVAAVVVALVAAPHAASASGTVAVRPGGLQGWEVLPEGGVAWSFGDATASTGSGSLEFGPVTSAPTQKFVAALPIDADARSVGLSFDYYLFPDTPATQHHQHLYFNLFVEVPGQGTCRFDLASARERPVGSVPKGVWRTNAVEVGGAWTFADNAPAHCKTRPALLPEGSRAIGLQLNGGQSSASDAGIHGAFDNVVLTTGDGVTVYDFEPPLPAPSSKDDCKKDGWRSVFRADGSAFVNQGDCIQYVNTGR